MKCVLKCGRTLIGAILPKVVPCGGGAVCPFSQLVQEQHQHQFRKIICWEHLNFADQIIAELDKVLQRQSVVLIYTLGFVLDINLIIRSSIAFGGMNSDV